MQMNQKSFFALCLSTAVLVAAASLVVIQHSKNRSLAALSRGRSAQGTSRAGSRPSASQDFLFDPVLVYSSFLGGPSYSDGLGEIVQFASLTYADSTGNLYLTGGTVFKTFPTTPGVVQPTLGSSGSFLAKVDPTGHHLVFSTYLPFHAPVSAMTVDAAGNIYVAGGSTDSTIPIPSGLTPYRTSGSLGIVKLNPTATTVLAATYLGGSGADVVGGIALDSSNNLYITGRTQSNDFPTSPSPLQSSLGTSGVNDYVTVLNSSLTTAVYSTYLGRNSSADTGFGHSIAVDASKNAYVTGNAGAGFPGTNGSSAQASCAGTCVFVAKLNPTGSAISYATYLGSDARGRSIAVDGSQNIFVSGIVFDGGFNELNPVSTFPSCNANLNEGENFASKIAASGALAFSTCFPGSSSGNSALDSSGNMYVFGAGFSSLPLTHPIQSHDVGPYIVGINPNSSSVVFASFLGAAQAINDIAVDSTGNIYAAGYAQQGSGPALFPVFNAVQPAPGGFTPCPNNPCGLGSDAIFLKIAPTDAPAAAVAPGVLTFPAQQIGAPSAASPVTIIDLGSTDLTVSNVAATGDFSVQQSCATVAAAGGACPVQVTFTPTAAGTRTGTLTITDNSAGSPRTVALTGTGSSATAILAPTSLTFGMQAPNSTSAPQKVTVTNSGAIPLAISKVAITGPFAETNNCGTGLGPGPQSCGINVTFTPTAAGAATGTLTITDSASDSPQTVALTGGNAGLGLSVASGGSASATVSAGQTATYSLSIGGQGVAGTATFTCTGAPTGATCNVPASTPFSATTASKVSVSITTTAHSGVLPIHFTPMTWLWAFAALGCLIAWKFASGQSSPRLRWSLVPLFAIVLCACGGGSNGSSSAEGTQAGSYTLVVTAKSGSTTQTQNLTLLVN
jgi:Beta-propeller repeat/Abnormal spindle-like microcephaly-assoc'd, ASPM-SPD-2-Hydin